MRTFVLLALAGCDGGGGAGPFFQHEMFFNRDVSSAPTAADSAQIIGALRAAGGWGYGDRMFIDFTFDVLRADAATPRRSFTPTADFFQPDCDLVDVPLPPGGNVEGETGYACGQAGDCHLLVYDHDDRKLYEMWRANLVGDTFEGGCLAVWDVARDYGAVLRGDQCSSADAAGLPIAPLLFDADEVARGHIDHTVRFTLPADHVREGFVRPATHAAMTTGRPGAPYFGVHLRLRADYPVETLPSEGARVVARALQHYGMIQADSGEIVLTAASDRYTQAKWSGLLGDRDLVALAVEDFEVVDHGSMIPLTDDCQR
jgi:serine/threonine-protein kinase